jgi:polyhydroxybutyrate depolymerase
MRSFGASKARQMKLHLLAGSLIASALTLLAHPVLAQPGEYMGWRVDGQRRRAIVYPPTSRSENGRAPLVLSFHGRGDNMENFQYTELHRAWPQAVVAYFEGLQSPRDGLRGWQVEKGQDEDRDLKLVDAALATLREKFRIDESRVYAMGFSNGAGFTYLLWAERPQVFAAFAPVAGRLRPSVQPTTPAPVIHIVGEHDRRVFAGQKEDVQAVLDVDGHGSEGESCGKGCILYGSGSAAPVMTWVHAGGHEYRDGTSERIAKFFREHPRRAR